MGILWAALGTQRAPHWSPKAPKVAPQDTFRLKGGAPKFVTMVTNYEGHKLTHNISKNKNISTSIDRTIKIKTGTQDCESKLNPEGQGEALPVTDRETCSRGREGLVTHAVVAISAQDMREDLLILVPG